MGGGLCRLARRWSPGEEASCTYENLQGEVEGPLTQISNEGGQKEEIRDAHGPRHPGPSSEVGAGGGWSLATSLSGAQLP